MKHLSYVCLLFLCTACTEFLSQDVSEVMIPITSPVDSLYTSTESISFWWETETKVEQYRLQVVSPDFDNPDVLLDTLFTDNFLKLSLFEGSFSWRLRAENESSESNYETRSFYIDQTPPQQARLIYPIQDAQLDQENDVLELRWESFDEVIGGTSFPVIDSLRLYVVKNEQASLLGSLVIEENEVRQTDVRALVTPELNGTMVQFEWEVSNTDRAGNRTLSETFRFSVQ